ncbi:CBS domain-containing protein [Streptomyces sp. NBC_00237]|uniref:CBS domain-containing protein n=1 Tax=Streptomyces sp. NBC_00237 TaxID=2975687 RepID=UPI00225B1BD8|nr:CBS domain-containing protein [Streptomyces sp. NBC_00237]MCX5205776.1 CBS domain-containing protein [Streptomyces sp. NBC_00237]
MPSSPHIVSDVMTQTVVSIGRDAPFKEIVELLAQWKVSALPVLEGEGRVIGVVSEADLLPKEEYRDETPEISLLDRNSAARPSAGRIASSRERHLAELAKAGAATAGDLMSTPAITVLADTTLAQAARIMARLGVKRLPVIDRIGILQGVVSRSDLLKVFLRPDAELAAEVHRTLSPLFPQQDVTTSVEDGVVTLRGTMHDRRLVPVAARLAHAVEGIVDVRMDLTTPDTPR